MEVAAKARMPGAMMRMSGTTSRNCSEKKRRTSGGLSRTKSASPATVTPQARRRQSPNSACRSPVTPALRGKRTVPSTSAGMPKRSMTALATAKTPMSPTSARVASTPSRRMPRRESRKLPICAG